MQPAKRNNRFCPVGKSGQFAPRLTHPVSDQAFTLTELAVVIVVIAVLGLLFLPAVAATHDRSNRAVCQYHLQQIAIAMTAYAADNNDTVLSARSGGGTFVPITLSNPSASGAKQIGLSTNLNINNIWTCPDRPGLPIFEPSQWDIGYQYFGGITAWNTDFGSVSARSPVKMSQAKPYWTLAADALIKIGPKLWAGQGWPTGDPHYMLFANIPPHRTADAITPQGGNQVFCDGSVQWIDIEKMYRLHYWSGIYGAVEHHFYQDSVDFDSRLRAILPGLAAQP